jgi:hypothetical protein
MSGDLHFLWREIEVARRIWQTVHPLRWISTNQSMPRLLPVTHHHVWQWNALVILPQMIAKHRAHGEMTLMRLVGRDPLSFLGFAWNVSRLWWTWGERENIKKDQVSVCAIWTLPPPSSPGWRNSFLDMSNAFGYTAVPLIHGGDVPRPPVDIWNHR